MSSSCLGVWTWALRLVWRISISCRNFTSGGLPPVRELTAGDDGPEEVHIDVDKVVRAVLAVLLS